MRYFAGLPFRLPRAFHSKLLKLELEVVTFADTMLSPGELARGLEKASEVFGRANIVILPSYRFEPTDAPFFPSEGFNKLRKRKNLFVVSRAKMRPGLLGWVYPFQDWAVVCDPIAIPHEIGHMLGLFHVRSKSNLMYKYVREGGLRLTWWERKLARLSHLLEPMR